MLADMDCLNKHNIIVKRYHNKEYGETIYEINEDVITVNCAVSNELLAKLIAKHLGIEYNPKNYYRYYGSEDYYDNIFGKGSKNKIYSYLDYYCFHEKINLKFE